MDRGASQATVYGVMKSQTRLSNFHFTIMRSPFVCLLRSSRAEHVCLAVCF